MVCGYAVVETVVVVCDSGMYPSKSAGWNKTFVMNNVEREKLTSGLITKRSHSFYPISAEVH